jgi:hypothetical protein
MDEPQGYAHFPDILRLRFRRAVARHEQRLQRRRSGEREHRRGLPHGRWRRRRGRHGFGWLVWQFVLGFVRPLERLILRFVQLVERLLFGRVQVELIERLLDELLQWRLVRRFVLGVVQLLERLFVRFLQLFVGFVHLVERLFLGRLAFLRRWHYVAERVQHWLFGSAHCRNFQRDFGTGDLQQS